MKNIKKNIFRLWVLLFLFIFSIVLFIASVNYNPYNLFGGMPSLQDLEKPESDVASELYSSDNLLLGKYFRYNRSPVEFNELSNELITTLLVTEDIRFYDHSGIDFKGLVRASYGVAKNVLTFGGSGLEGGGSTITQQLAKNLFLTPERSFTRKLHELILSFWLEMRFTKQQLLSIYLNRVYLGSGTYGVQAASEKYFNKKVEELNLYECALIASLLKAPSKYNPISNEKLSRIRTSKVLENMAKNKLITIRNVKEAQLNNKKYDKFTFFIYFS